MPQMCGIIIDTGYSCRRCLVFSRGTIYEYDSLKCFVSSSTFRDVTMAGRPNGDCVCPVLTVIVNCRSARRKIFQKEGK